MSAHKGSKHVLAQRLRAEARELGIDPKRATTADLVRIAHALPKPLYDELVQVAKRADWDPNDFIATFVAPLLVED
jgi:hypothetical protein